MNNNSTRASSLDALRGYAILTMVLSGSVAWGVLPGWMYHAQVGPRSNFVFDGSIYGITWVDLVFPFFLFAMGAAFPFSIGNKYRKGSSRRRIIYDSLLRGFRLTFFAIFIQHIYPWVVSSPQDVRSWLIALGGFALMFPMFMRIPFKMPEYVRMLIKILAYATGVFMLLNINYADGRTFSLGYSNIIILVLANMAIFGSLIYTLTINKPWIRIAILPFIMAVFLGNENAESWNHSLMAFSPLPWMYKFSYLKYLFIVIPGSIAGEYLHEWLHCKNTMPVNDNKDERKRMPWILLLTIGLIVFNLYGLYMRYLFLNLVGTIAILCVLYIPERSFYVQLLLPCIGTCLYGDDCIFYYVRHLFLVPIDPSIGICRAESDDCIRIHPVGSITSIESGRTGNLSFLSGSKCLAGLFTGSHHNFSGFINNHIIY